MRLNLACLFVALAGTISGFSQTHPTAQPTKQTPIDSKPIKINIYPTPPPMALLQELPNGILRISLEVDSTGLVVDSKRIDGFLGAWHKLKPFVDKTKFSRTQSNCEGPWSAVVELETKANAIPGTKRATIRLTLVSAQCTNKNHHCPYGS